MDQKQNTNYSVRRLRYDDYKDLLRVWSDPVVIKFTLTGPGMTLDGARTRVERALNDPNETTFVAEVPNVGVVGMAGITQSHLNKQTHTGTVYLMIHSAYHGIGIGSAFFREMLHLADNELGIQVVELKCHCDNIAGLNLYRKFGFQIEGVLRKRTNVDGVLKDLFIMSRIHPNLK